MMAMIGFSFLFLVSFLFFSFLF
eukprot:COSAG06_NODE_69350_length_198_cov_17.777778_2_plen_22_part_01